MEWIFTKVAHRSGYFPESFQKFLENFVNVMKCYSDVFILKSHQRSALTQNTTSLYCNKNIYEKG